MTLIDSLKKAGRRAVDSGAKTMIKADIALLERDIKQRKQKFGVEVYDCMAMLEVDNEMPLEEKEQRIRHAFDRARKDIAVINAKMECKKEEIAVLDSEMAAYQRKSNNNNSNWSGDIPPSSGNIIMTGHPDDDDEYGDNVKQF